MTWVRVLLLSTTVRTLSSLPSACSCGHSGRRMAHHRARRCRGPRRVCCLLVSREAGQDPACPALPAAPSGTANSDLCSALSDQGPREEAPAQPDRTDGRLRSPPCRPARPRPTMLQMDLASSENFSEYCSASRFTLRSTSSRLTFSLYFLNGERPSIISYIRQPSPHQSGLNV